MEALHAAQDAGSGAIQDSVSFLKAENNELKGMLERYKADGDGSRIIQELRAQLSVAKEEARTAAQRAVTTPTPVRDRVNGSAPHCGRRGW